jgi:ABC-type transporter Mla MlaB component
MAKHRPATMRSSRSLRFSLRLLQLICLTGVAAAATNDYFTIRVVDEKTGRGVPLVELRTVNKTAWWTDSNGIVAFDEPGLMDMEVFFFVSSPGYKYPGDLLGNRGVKLKPTHGDSATIKIKRLNIAERLYRITGQGIYRDSVLVGRSVPIKQPALNGQVMGQDTVIATPYRGKIYWFWGDTDRASYPLGNFGASGATSELPGHGGLDPGIGVDLTYFVDDTGFGKPMCQLPGPAAHWIEGPFTIRDGQGAERLVTRVANQTHLGDAESWDLMIFNNERAVFEPVKHWNVHDPHESAHPFHARVDGVEYFYLFPNWRVKADLKSIQDLTNYEALTCVAGDGMFHSNKTEIDRDAADRPRYRWKAGADRLHPNRVRELISAGKLKPEESWIDLFDFETGERIEAAGGSVCWNDFRRRWVMLNELTKAGEIWFAEADTPAGPWVYARRVVTHGDYNFYNPTQHPFFDQEGGRLVYFEGTYSDFFSGARSQTPRYDYNQVMYRLALDDPRLALPVAVYHVRGTNGIAHLWLRDQVEAAEAWERIEDVAFFALPPTCHGSDLVPVYATEKNGTVLSLTPPVPGARPLFVGLPLKEREPATTLEGSWEFCVVAPDGNELKFPLRFSLQGETVQVEDLEPDTTGSGTSHNSKLTLTLKTRDGTFVLEGQLEKRSLTGTWRQQDATPKGTWSASPVDTIPVERRSPALAVLREYRRLPDGRSDYSAQPQPLAGYEPTGRELCRVWKAPGSVLVLDWKAKPIPVGGK